MTIKLTIITPVFNGKSFIQSCIDNVFNQHCCFIEHIILDAGSTDGTVEILRKNAEKYTHLRWVSGKDKGQSDAMNKGIEMARGEIVGFLNVDDFYEPNVLNRIVEVFTKLPEPALLVGNCNVLDGKDNLLFVNKPAKLKLAHLLTGPEINPWPINPSAYFYHKSLHDRIGPYDVNEHYALDLDFILRAVQAAYVRYINEVWGNFRLIEGTKTYVDQEIEKNVARYKIILDSYKSNLPCFIRCIYPFYKILQRIEHWANYIWNPRLFMIVLRNKLKRFFNAT